MSAAGSSNKLFHLYPNSTATTGRNVHFAIHRSISRNLEGLQHAPYKFWRPSTHQDLHSHGRQRHVCNVHGAAAAQGRRSLRGPGCHRRAQLSHRLCPRYSKASGGQRTAQMAKTEFPAEHIKELEQWIDAHSENLPPLKNFILPSGSPAGAALHIARSVCRRAERRVTSLFLEKEVDEVVMKYINRLSDYLFVAARVCSHHENAEETIYK